jgi:hypothetical protein
LKDCGDRELLEWGGRLLAETKRIGDAYMAIIVEQNKLPADAKWLQKNAEANETAGDQFRDCCAADTLSFHRELALRVGGGFEDADAYQWAQKLLSPVQSDDWKAARENAGYRVNSISYSLRSLCTQLDLKIRLAGLQPTHRTGQ